MIEIALGAVVAACLIIAVAVGVALVVVANRLVEMDQRRDRDWRREP